MDHDVSKGEDSSSFCEEDEEVEEVAEIGAQSNSPPKPRFYGKYNFISRLLLLWADPLFWTGYQHTLEYSDLYEHPSEADSEKLLERFNKHWKTELDRKKSGKKPRLLLAVLKCFWLRIIVHGLCLFSEVTLQVIQSVLLGYLANSFISETTVDVAAANSSSMEMNGTTVQPVIEAGIMTRNAYLFAGGIVLAAVAIMLFHGHTFLMAYKIGMISRIIMTGAVYQKVLWLNQVVVGRISIGHIVNLASNDVQRFDLAFLFAHILWIAPIHVAVVTYLVYLEVGWCAFLMTAFICLQIPLQIFLARHFAKLRFKSALLTDQRVRIMNEIITGIRVIKMYAWENAFKRVVTNLRKKESFIILRAGFVRAASLAFMIISLTLIMFIIFTAFTATGGVLSPKKVFTTLSLLITLRLTTVHFLVQNVLAMVEGRVATVRLQQLLELDEVQYEQEPKYSEEEIAVVVKNMSTSWDDQAAKLVLHDINISVTKDSRLMTVVGPVGSGKSTLLQCLLGELKPVEGTVEVNGRVSYASQDPWVFSATLRENILFGTPYDREWYNKVIKVCALDKDIELLVDGDLTLVGERGVTLSGGQKARVNLARAVYHEADIYLLDDPLSAVDTAVGKHLFEECICGLLKDRLVVLVTHQVHFALSADQILVLKEGGIEAYGSHADLLSKGLDPEHLLGLISANNKEKGNKELYEYKNVPDTDEGTEDADVSIHSPLLSRGGANRTRTPNHSVLSPNLRRRNLLREEEALPGRQPDISIFDTASIYSSPSLRFPLGEDSEEERGGKGENILHEKIEERRVSVVIPEEKERGTVSARTYYHYFRAGGGTLLIVTVFLCLLFGETGIVVADWWLSDWASCSAGSSNISTCSLTTNERIYIYSGMTFFALVLSFVRSLAFYFVCVNASRVLHNRMFRAILRTPVLFFDTNPIGRVLNRFSKDVGFLDDLLPYIYTEFVLLSFRCFAIIMITLVANWWTLLPAAVLMLGLVLIRWYYLKTAREVKRMEAVARSPVYSHLSTTLQGLPTIRAFRRQHTAKEHFHNFQNEHTQAWYLYLITTRWLGMRVDTVSAVFVAAVTFISIGLVGFVSNTSLIGLSITYTISLSGMFQYVIRQSAEVENLMISSERIMEYARLEPEASLETSSPNEKPPEDWPSKGELRMEDVAFRYSPELPMVLKNLNFSVKPSEKVGIVGRTGAGKSSLLSVLYRLAEPYGQITIDGVDTKTIGLHDLRKKMSIIPQDPVLFSGSMRYNLDPFDEYSDAQLWEVLEQVQLKAAVKEIEGQLSGEVTEGGSNFSVGQRQLVCLARALLRKNKILILDEATANVDPKTDEIIQAAIRRNFSDTTVLTIAHRLNTIMDSDRILVMGDGQLLEYDSPCALLENQKSQFSAMVSKTGAEASRRLYQMAIEADRERKSNIGGNENCSSATLVTEV